MRRIDEIDKNFKVETKIQREGLAFFNSLENPFKIYGLTYVDGMFRRVPESVAKSTYNKAIARGDKNVYFVGHEKVIALCGSDGTVDNSHPNDLGFTSMANAFEKVLEKIL